MEKRDVSLYVVATPIGNLSDLSPRAIEVLKSVEEKEDINRALIAALESSANQFTPTRFSYDEFKKLHGDLIFGGLQPKRALDAVKSRLADDGFFLKTGVHVFRKKRQSNGFIIQQIDSTEPEQMDIDI